MNSKTGLMFHIIQGSFIDGHGVRTTVFLKGCPLRCIWCCNPEGQERHSEIKFTDSLCNGCGRCLKICTAKAIEISLTQHEDKKVHINRNICTNCGKCIEVCHAGALDYFGKYIEVDELFDLINKDEQFYRSSGGGVTIGGGEPTYQPVFIQSFLKKCKENYIHTALDTCGYTTNREALKCLDNADLLLYDIKGWDIKEHLKNTGVPIEPILGNIKRSDSLGKPIIIRIPLIPGCNDSVQNAENIAKFLSTLRSVERIDILAYHKFGAIKYAQLGKEYKLNLTQPPMPEHLDLIKCIFERHGLKVQLGG